MFPIHIISYHLISYQAIFNFIMLHSPSRLRGCWPLLPVATGWTTFLLPLPRTKKGWQHVWRMRMRSAKRRAYFIETPMLCYVMLCYVMLCYVMLCYVMLCYVMLCNVMLCYVMLCYVMLCYVMLCYVMLCDVMLCYVMLCYVM